MGIFLRNSAFLPKESRLTFTNLEKIAYPMFEYFQKSIAPDIEVVGYEAPEVVIRSSHPLDLGVTDVRATIAGVRMKARIDVIEIGTESCRGFWLEPKEAIPYLAELFAPPEKRRSQRYSRTLRVKSPQGFQGWSVDLSPEGLRLETPNGIGLGQTVQIQVDLDDCFNTQLECTANVRWCAPALTDGWIVAGLEYHPQGRSAAELQRYFRYIDKLGPA